MFMGQYEHTIDAKGRTIIPAKYREGLGETFIITRGLDGCLYLYPSDAWQEFADKLQSLPSTLQNRKIQRQFLSKAMEVSLDKQGRILIPSVLREFADITKDAVLVGVGSRIEIWSRERWEGTVSFEDMDEISNHMFELGIGI